MAATLDAVTEQIRAGNLASATRDNTNMKISTMTLEVLQSMLDLSLDDSAAARERAREAARSAKDPIANASPQAKTEEVKAKGFFSKLGRAVTSPIGAMGRSMKTAGKGVGGFLKGLSSGLASFANPMVLLGVTTMAVSLPIMAAGLAAAFKVFEMIAGEGKALEFVTGIIESLGEAIGTILQKVLEGFGNMVKNMGPFIKEFFEGMAVVIEALHPIVTDIFKAITDIITDPVLNVTLQKVLDVVGIALQELSAIIQKTGDVIIAVMENVDKILTSIFDGISKVIKTIGDSITGIIDKIVEGIERLAVLDAGNMLGVAAGLGAIALALVGFGVGAMVAGAAMPSADDFKQIANSIKMFGDIDSTNLKQVGDGIKAVGFGLMAFAAGEIMALLAPENSSGLDRIATSVQKFGKIDATGFAKIGDGIKKLGIGIAFFAGGEGVGAVMDFLTGWAKDKDTDPIENFKRWAEIGPGLSQAGMGVTALANSFDAFDEAKLQKIGVGLNSFLQSTDMAKLKAFSSATEGLVSGQMLAQLQVQTAQAAATGRPLIIQTNNSSQVNQSSAVMLPPDPVSPENRDI